MNILRWFKDNPLARCYNKNIREQEEQAIISTRDYVAFTTYELGEHCKQLSALLEDEKFNLIKFITDEEAEKIERRKKKLSEFSKKAGEVHQNVLVNRLFYTQRIGKRSIDEFFSKYHSFNRLMEEYLCSEKFKEDQS